MAKNTEFKDIPLEDAYYHRIKYATGRIESDICNGQGESVTDDSDFRPDISSVRDKAIALNKAGAGRIGLYDSMLQDIDDSTLLNLAYARGMSRDITEVEKAKKSLERYIENIKEEDKEKLKNAKETKEFIDIFKNIEKNTAPKEE